MAQEFSKVLTKSGLYVVKDENAATTAYVQEQTSGKLDKTGGTMTGGLTLAADPTEDLQAATKQYVDNNGFTYDYKNRVLYLGMAAPPVD